MNLIQHIRRQRDWSLRTLGPECNPTRTIAHIRKELEEIERDPSDLMEWIDVIILAIDGAHRAGHSPAEIAYSLQYKQRINEARKWPDWRTVDPDNPIEHVR